MSEGTATLLQVKESQAGIEGWAKRQLPSQNNMVKNSDNEVKDNISQSQN